jgi:integrase
VTPRWPGARTEGKSSSGSGGASGRHGSQLATTRGHRDRVILEVLARAGLRRSELCALTWDDVVEVPRWPDARLRDAVAKRPADETAWALRVEHSKRGRDRLVPLARPVVAALEAWRATSASARAAPPASGHGSSSSLTRAREQAGLPLAPGAIGKIVAG